MISNEPTLKADAARILYWGVATPVLSFWALLSFLPVFSVIGHFTAAESGGVTALYVEGALAATGFLGVSALYLAAHFFVTAETAETLKAWRRRAGVPLAVYGAVWLGLYWASTALV